MTEQDERDDIGGWRVRIDDLDRRLLELLNERSRCSLAIGAIKRRRGSRVYDPVREAEIVSNVLKANGGPMGDDAIRRLFERILDESRRLERTSMQSQASNDGAEDV